MRGTLLVQWRLQPADLPLPWHHCQHCGLDRAFVCSGRFRCNLQKKRLDVWLIYRCRECGERWNLPVLERRSVKTVDKTLLDAFARDCPRQVRRHAGDLDLLRRHAWKIQMQPPTLVKEVRLGDCQTPPLDAVVTLCLSPAGAPRLDRLLAGTLGLSRQDLLRLIDAGVIVLESERPRAWRRVARDGQRIRFRLSEMDRHRADRLARRLA